MNGRKRSVMACVHGLKKVQSFFTAHLAQDDPVGAHAQGVDN